MTCTKLRFPFFLNLLFWLLPALAIGQSASERQLLFAQDSSGNRWINVQNGLFRLDSTGQARRISLDIGDSISVSNALISAICPASERRVFIATRGGGLFLFDEKTGRMTNFQHHPNQPASLPSDTISTLFFDGNLWVATSVGLSKWLAPLDVFRTFRPDSALKSFEKTTAILSDARDANRLWLVSPSCLFSFDKKTSSLQFLALPMPNEGHLVLPTTKPLVSSPNLPNGASPSVFVSKNGWWWLLGALLVLVSGWFFYKNLVQRIRRQEALRHSIQDVENQLLRTQMNPHFIFNSLNSIRSHILSNDRILAADYLGGFALLMRNILDHTRSERVPLREELDTLRLYVSLEQLRFKKKFDFELRIDPALPQDDIHVQPLILQPFVENAIRHGLQNKEERGHLTVEIARQNGSLVYKIEDDGPARARSEAIKAAAMSRAQELQITRDRLLLHQKDATIEWTDLSDAAVEKTGTRVEVKMKMQTADEEILMD